MRQRGFVITAWMYAAAALAALAMISALFFGVTSYLNGVDKRGYDRGVKEEKAKWLTRENKELTEANAKILALTAKYRALEQESVQNMTDIAAQHERDKANAQDKRDADIAAVVAGTIKLRDPGRTAASQAGCGSPAAKAGATAARGDETAGGELSSAASGFLLQEANRADEIVEQLNRAIDVIEADRKICG